ncbi:hypothetical protein [Kiritimatiella glycovorans]|uniref:Uncharacterized protein n=1 Tax=Kiritimatiella glycovorans TaxID=1307763 RepID=A0A0G3EIF4_9BACT|nr:hypothetical protein [Kiritimatiella glycovorans]AKJ64595.1 hypothetical protein L21SP4_01347 [Kiritimatiella glycovorans]
MCPLRFSELRRRAAGQESGPAEKKEQPEPEAAQEPPRGEDVQEHASSSSGKIGIESAIEEMGITAEAIDGSALFKARRDAAELLGQLRSDEGLNLGWRDIAGVIERLDAAMETELGAFWAEVLRMPEHGDAS